MSAAQGTKALVAGKSEGVGEDRRGGGERLERELAVEKPFKEDGEGEGEEISVQLQCLKLIIQRERNEPASLTTPESSGTSPTASPWPAYDPIAAEISHSFRESVVNAQWVARRASPRMLSRFVLADAPHRQQPEDHRTYHIADSPLLAHGDTTACHVSSGISHVVVTDRSQSENILAGFSKARASKATRIYSRQLRLLHENIEEKETELAKLILIGICVKLLPAEGKKVEERTQTIVTHQPESNHGSRRDQETKERKTSQESEFSDLVCRFKLEAWNTQTDPRNSSETVIALEKKMESEPATPVSAKSGMAVEADQSKVFQYVPGEVRWTPSQIQGSMAKWIPPLPRRAFHFPRVLQVTRRARRSFICTVWSTACAIVARRVTISAASYHRFETRCTSHSQQKPSRPTAPILASIPRQGTASAQSKPTHDVRFGVQPGRRECACKTASGTPFAGFKPLIKHRESFDNIYLDLSKNYGKCRFADSGFAWKPAQGGDTFTLQKEELQQAQWSRAARGYELRVLSRSNGINQFDGFQQEDFDRLAKAFKIWYGVNLDNKEHALRGWNWGKAEFGKAELVFNVQNRPAFEVPYTEISNTNLAGKNEVAVDFSLTGDEDAGTNGHLGGARAKGRKLAAARDQLVEARFYIPGTVTKNALKKANGDDGEEQSDEEDGDEEQSAAYNWYETLVDKADIGDVAGDKIVEFGDVLHLTPRGRFDMAMYEGSFRLRGKTYDYKVEYDSIKKVFVLPKPGEMHILITIGLDPPLRQGQTRYPWLVMQFNKDEDTDLEPTLSEEDLKGKWAGKLQAHYSDQTYALVGQMLKQIAGKRVSHPSKDFISRHQQSGVKCSIKANEGHLFFMDKGFLFVPKPATWLLIENVALVTMSRVGGAISASRTFDVTFTMKNGAGETQFSNINREEQQPLEDFFKAKNLKVRNEMNEEVKAGILAAALDAEMSSDEEVSKTRGSADEDSEEDDEDFQGGSDSDVADEFDSNVEDSGDSDAEMDDASGDDQDKSEVAERPKKKAKTEK
ncbi:hypothetical protein FH972_026678 [Carpinus fangiana]|uniref:Histone chaperone RTT106/FACT complex subunit SPT16-like middle domain-containing protein n=1 Tax=Carpinus fangiana TaxID=176857 RepID=A0A5N6L547_9ROSI|nr:hypothetical protein FH972_026678 [Carpinus fangiana]